MFAEVQLKTFTTIDIYENVMFIFIFRLQGKYMQSKEYAANMQRCNR